MAQANLTTKQTISQGKDSVAIVQVIDTLRGGRTLDTTGYKAELIRSGHPIIKESSTGNIKPLPVNADYTAYEALPSGHSYVGVLISTTTARDPRSGILIHGTVNHLACHIRLEDTVVKKIKQDCPNILFVED